ncbi:hypothetical protein [Paenibacillus tianjinensis]|uniref:Uncharacterized protein n=1 Tax=Paenibacillus tianjinensis TaxID=2810347 RepID=A0ABX7L7U2_9BACL|nr:hypothetical protein [Paenibacillus tianjinensis]QSF43406.1 hypothetical protein JRJ22_19260 [Paenibacillus tianjinensis]
MSFCPHGNGQSCFYCEDCGCHFGIECLDVPEQTFCPRCGSEDTILTNERLVGKVYREYESVEQYEQMQEFKRLYKELNGNASLLKTLDK